MNEKTVLRAAIVIATLGALFRAPPAFADPAYICGLTQGEVESALAFYDSPLSFQDMVPLIDYPFNCSSYGDTCAELGSTLGQAFVCNRWSDALNEVSAATLAASAMSDWNAKEASFFNSNFPQGVPADDTYWGASASCQQTVAVTSGNLRTRERATYTLTGIYNAIGSNATAYVSHDSGASFSRDGDGSVSTTNHYTSVGDLSTCTSSNSHSDNDGYVAKAAYCVFCYSVPESEDSDGVGNSVSANNACRIAPWSDSGCP